MNVLIISDSHGLEEELQTIAKRHEAEVDLMIHCGDSELETKHPALEPYAVVKGNCDFAGDFKDELLLTAGSRKILVTHGHLHGIKQTLLNVYYRAEEPRSGCYLLRAFAHRGKRSAARKTDD